MPVGAVAGVKLRLAHSVVFVRPKSEAGREALVSGVGSDTAVNRGWGVDHRVGESRVVLFIIWHVDVPVWSDQHCVAARDAAVHGLVGLFYLVAGSICLLTTEVTFLIPGRWDLYFLSAN